MRLQAYLALIRQMRRAQRSFYQTRSPSDLNEAKRLERELDRATDLIAQRMEHLENMLGGQQHLTFESTYEPDDI